jgi:outer membrane immunogenic protein
MRRLLFAFIGIAVLAVPGTSASAQPAFQNWTGSNSASASSWLGGAQAGYNWQRGSFVYGLEADISAMHLKSEMNTVLQTPFTTTANTNASVDWYGTARGRLGWASGPLLFYGTAGLAYGKVDLNSTISANGPAIQTLSLSAQTSPVKVGWVAGGGLEYMWRPNLILNLEYQYVDLGTVSVADPVQATITLSQSASAHAQFNVFTVGLSWLLSPNDTVPQASWGGPYVGGHIGGAWGNNTNAYYSATSSSGGICCPCDVRLKRNIMLVGRLEDGLGIYRYQYLWSNTIYVGVLAQEVALDHPDAVVRDPFGYLSIDYRKLGLKLMTLSEWEARGKIVRLPANRFGKCLLSGAERT